MEKEFISYEQALALKELVFDEPCLGYYLTSTLFISNDVVYNSTDFPVIKAPLYQQVFRWFRDKYELYHEIIREKGINDSSYIRFIPIIQFKIKKKVLYTPSSTYEEAELKCLNKLIELTKK